MEQASKLSPAVNHNKQRGARIEPPTASPAALLPPNPPVSQQASRGNLAGLSPKPAAKGGTAPRGRGYSSSRPVRDGSEGLGHRSRSTWDPQAKASKSNNDPFSRITGRSGMDAPRKGFRGARSAPNSAGRPKPEHLDAALFEVKMADFPELAGASPANAVAPVARREGWGPKASPTSPQSPQTASAWKFGSRGAPAVLEAHQSARDVKPDPRGAPADQPVATSWANIASQPPKKPAPDAATISENLTQTEDVSAQQEEAAPGKKKRKKKKKAKSATEDAETQPDETPVPQEPPKFEDEEEFPGLTPSSTGAGRFLSHSGAKLCNQGSQREGGELTSMEHNKEKSPVAKSQPAETTKKAQKAEKVSGKKSKVPVQLDIGNMLAALEKKQQSQKAKQEVKPLILSVGGGLPVVQKQSSALKKPAWKQDKIAHNPLDSTSPLVKKGKQREVPKAKKPTPLKRVILKEREERKQRRLQEERALQPEEEADAPNEAAEEEEEEEEEQCEAEVTASDELADPPENVMERDNEEDSNGADQVTEDGDEGPQMERSEQKAKAEPEPQPAKIHSRKFRDYCSQMLSKEVDECVTTLLRELVRFQDRLYQKDPMKARMKRRIVMGLREVLKHLKLRKVKCVIISPNCERSQSKGGLDEALHAIIDTCREQDVPFVFALSRKSLGRCVNKAVPVSLVGIFNYDGAQDFYHKMIELSSEARRAYEVMVSSLEQSGVEGQEVNADEPQVNTEEPDSDCKLPEEPEYIWKKMLEKECNHAFLRFEEQLSSVHLNSECTENGEEDEKS